MKKYTSVFALFVRSSIYKVVGVLLLMAAVEFGRFYWNLRAAVKHFETSGGTAFPNLEQLLYSSGIFWCFAAALVLISAALCLPGCEFNGKTGYTLKRLSITDREVVLTQAVYNLGVYLLLFFTQTVVCFGLCRLYTASAPTELISNQTVFLAFYRSPFLHSLLPMGEFALWVRNLFLVTALGWAAAVFHFIQRKKKFPVGLVIQIVLTILFFSSRNIHIGNHANILLMIVVSCAVLGEGIYSVYREEWL